MIMNTLQHKSVIIHPDLRTDPLQMQGKIGYISASNLERDDFFVDFQTGKTGLYSASALLVLRPHYDVYKALMAPTEPLDKQEFKNLMRISMLLQFPDYQNAADGLRLALSAPKVLPLATQPLAEQLHLYLSADWQMSSGSEPGR